MGDVRKLAEAPREPSKLVVSTLERLLEEAKRGELVGFTIACCMADQTVSSENAGELQRHKMNTALDYAKLGLLGFRSGDGPVNS